MKSNEQVIGLLKAIFFLAISIAMILIGYVISGGEENAVTVVLVYAGIVCFFVGVFIGIGNFTSPKDDNE
jgi:VIT1/CCC1 family predicted Fe2+/Mn2+ transporter